jgi:TANFOR domain-containing protein
MFTRRKSNILGLLLLLSLSITAKAQLTVQTTVLPPYSPYISDYYGYEQKVTVRIINPTNNTYQVRLLGHVKGGNINVSVKQNYKPNSAINVGPGVTLLKGGQLSPYFSESALSFQGITKQEVLFGNGLPEGNYQMCFWAVNYNSNQTLSTPNQGCANFTITHYEAPMLTTPACNAEVKSKNPQNQIFNWTIPAGVLPSNVEYELTVVEVNPPNLNANQALESATDPVFFRKKVSINTYIYKLSDPKLEEGKFYAWRVRAMAKPGKKLNFKNNGYSSACKFKYVSGIPDQNNQNNDPPEDENGCTGLCDVEAPQNNNPYNPKVGDTVFIGKFSMLIKSINGSNGTGEIRIPFLKANVAVDFKNLSVNTDMQAFGNSKATAKIGNNSLIDQALANDPNGNVQLTSDKMNQIQNYINQGQHLVSQFSPNMEPVPVPFAQDHNGFNWQILGLIFTPTKAYMNGALGLELTDAFENNWIDMGMKGICIRPNGYGSLPKIQLQNDETANLSNDVSLVVKGNNASYVELSCDGVEKVHIDGEFVISRNKLLPHNGTKVIEGAQNKVKAVFSVNVTANSDWVVNATMTPSTFVLPEAKDVILTAQSAVLDQSDAQNAANFALHPNHPKKKSDKDWKGIYIKNISALLPKEFKKNNQAIGFGVKDLIIDKTGVWFKASVQNLVTMNDGSLGGWKFSVEEFGLDVRGSAVEGGSMEGGLQLPIAKSGIAYSAMLSKGNDGLDYSFGIGNLDEIDADLWLATLSLKPGSKVTITKQNNKVTPGAVLNGSISIAFNQSPDNSTALSKLSLNNIDFQELTISGGNTPEIDFAFVSLNAQQGGEQHSMNKFPLNLTELTYENMGNPGIVFGLGINLVKGSNGFNAETTLKIKGKYNAQDKRFKYNGIDLQSVTIGAQMGVIDLEGKIDLYKEDPTFGTGFRGDISATVKVIGVAIDATLQVGKIGNGIQENANNYRYWYADISARWSVGLVVPGAPAIAFYGFSGGAYKNMERQSPQVVSNASMPDIKGKTNDMTAGKTRSGVTYTPKKGSAGFMAGVTLGTAGEPTAFNADLKLLVQFNTDNFGITKIVLEGNGYIMGPILDRSKNLLEVSITIEADFEHPSFDANMTINGGFDQSKLKVSVSASLNIHASPDLWFVKVGYWTNDDEPWKDPKRIQVDLALDAKIAKAALNFNAYFMMGNDIGDLPRSPLKVRNMLSQKGKSDNKTLPADLALGKGFAFGAGIRFFAELDFAIFYTDIEFILGADVLLSKNNLTCNGSYDYGINQWYAKGNAYAYLDVDAGIRLNMWLWKGEFSLIAFQTAAEIRAELPNPYWLSGKFALKGSLFNGLIKIDTKYKMEVGEKCQWGDGSEIKEIPIIEELRPGEGEKETVFAAPQASLNFPLNQVILLKDHKGKSKTVRFSLISVQLKKGNTTIPGKYHLNNARNGLTFLADKTLPEKSKLTFTVKAMCKQNIKGKWVVLRVETKTVSFKTDVLPDYIDPQNVIKAYPQIRQRYFLQDDEDEGNIHVGLSQCYLLQKKEDAKFTYSYKLQLRNVETGQKQLIPFTCVGKDFRYSIPKMANETVYEMRFLRIAKPKNSKINTKKNTKTVYTNLKGVPVNYKPAKVGNLVLNNNNNNGLKLKGVNKQPIKHSNKGGLKLKGNGFNSGMSNSNSILVRKNKIAFDQQKKGQKVDKLFSYYFRTSRYNTAAQKYGKYKPAGFGSMHYNQIDYGYDWITVVPFPLVHGDENMDVYDAYGYDKKNFNIYVEPLVKLKIDWSNNGYYKTINTKIYGARYKDYVQKTVDITHMLKKNRYADRIFFGRTDLTFSSRPFEAVKVWSPYTEGPIHLNSNQKMLKPKGKLTNAEIAKAKNGIKLNETVGIKYVIPLTDYSAGVVMLDAIGIYLKHKSWCNDDHWPKYKEKNCYADWAYPLLKNIPLSQTHINPYSVIPNNQSMKYVLTYSYYKYTPYNRTLNFIYKK